MTIQTIGALAFGLVIGWYVYYVNRYRAGDVQLGDIVTVIGAIGGAAVLALFPAASDLFGAYGIGLAAGFFLYFVVLIIFVAMSKNFTVEWFLDGRRKKALPESDWVAGPPDTQRPMGQAAGPRGGPVS